jgi:ferredoxin
MKTMGIPTSRTRNQGELHIIPEKCTGCGLCASVCKDFSLTIENGKVTLSSTSIFGCTGCGHCMAICPTGAIKVSGREISPSDLLELPGKATTASYEQLKNLMIRRRSIREFRENSVEKEKIDKILEAAVTSPMGLPPSDVNVLIFDSREKLNNFAKDFCHYLEGMKWLVSPWFLTLMRPFWGKANDELFRDFVKPLFDIYISRMQKDENVVTYNAPMGIYFYGSPWCDPADPLIAATYAMLAGETLGLGTCMLGGIHPLIQSGRRAARFRKKWNIRFPAREGLFVIFGYPDVKYTHGIRRTFASVNYN